MLWWITAIAAVLTVGFGAFGMREYDRLVDPDAPIDGLSILYHSLQLLILHAPHLEHEHLIPWQLHVGRLLGAVPLAIAGATALLRIFPDAWKQVVLRLPWTRPHVVVCGLGATGTQVALEGRRQDLPVVAIEHACPPEVRLLMRAHGVLVLDGDATDRAQLRAARVDRAAFVVAACPTDETNVAIASTIDAMVSGTPRRGDALICRTLIRDSDTRQLLAREGLLATNLARYRVDFSDLDRDAVAARLALARHPLDFEPIGESSDVQVHLVVVGCSAAGRALALHAARIGHFANEVGPRKRRLRVTLVDETADDTLEYFNDRYPNFSHVCEVAREPLADEADLDRLSQVAGVARTLTTYAFCNDGPDGDRINLRRAVSLARTLQGKSAQILVRQRSRASLAVLLGEQLRSALGFERLHPFGMFEDALEWDVVLHGGLDQLASMLHRRYRALRLASGDPEHTQPTWEALDEPLRDSNRQAADHIPIKLRAIGYHLAPVKDRKGPRIPRFEDTEIDLVARMEHARWCAERWLGGWTYGPATDRAKKINKNLVDWDKLEPSEQRKDPEQINSIAQALDAIGLGIYRDR